MAIPVPISGSPYGNGDPFVSNGNGDPHMETGTQQSSFPYGDPHMETRIVNFSDEELSDETKSVI